MVLSYDFVKSITSFFVTDEKAKDEPVQGRQPSCDQCTGALKQEGKRNVPFIPSFRRGRLGNISIDSKSLRSGHGGPGYAAPVVRKVATENSEPKSFKVIGR